MAQVTLCHGGCTDVNRLPSAKPWHTHTAGYFPGGGWDSAGVSCLDNGDVYVLDNDMWNNLIQGQESFATYGYLYKLRDDGSFMRMNPDGAWAHPYYISGSGNGNGFDVQEGYLPHEALMLDNTSLGALMSTDGTDLFFHVQGQGKLLHLDVSTLQLDLWIGVSAASGTPTATNSGLGSTSVIGNQSVQFVRVGNHLYWMDNVISGGAYLNHIRRVSDAEPHGTETITPSSWTSVPSWWTASTDVAKINPSTRLPYGQDPDSHVQYLGANTTHGLAYDNGYFYFFQEVGWSPGFEPSWWSGTIGGTSALRRWKWPDPATNNQADIETLYYSYGRGVVSDFESQPEGASTGDYFWKDGLGGPLLEGFRVPSSTLHVRDGWLYAHNWGAETISFGVRYGQALVRFNIAELEAYVAENGGPMLHDRENPFYETINQATGWWVGGGDVVWNSRDRWQHWRDGGEPINHTGLCTYDIGKGTHAGSILMLGYEFDDMWMNGSTIHTLRVLREEGPPSQFNLTLSFEGLRMKGYQAQTQIEDLFVPEVVTLS